MKEEIACACEFLCSKLRSDSNITLTQGQLETFRTVLNDLIVDKFTNHWYPSKPIRGSGFRCVNIDKDTKIVDPMLIKAAEVSDITKDIFLSVFRFGLALWVDPGDVSYRTGHSSNVMSLYRSVTNVKCTPLPVSYQFPVSNQSLYKPVYTNALVVNAFDHQWKGQSNTITYPQLTSKQLKQLQRGYIDRFHWKSTNYFPKQVTEVY
ncbi:protein BTG2-like [Dendronephthya gigantea]|uniref:protein BTG2-like n=1 Tax=Dendronephthya gigantea TaxID=151771 RepID=UPI00106C74D6|nr:protein BTG2-like [Dendronephthya gigantea]